MGVTGLWNLVDNVGHPINLESLHNKVIAIDLSLWINQSIKGIRGRNGGTVENAHVLGLFNRICKLLFYKIKPVFVFDGKCPQLKQNTIAKRVEQRLKAIDKSREASIKVLHNYVATQLSSSGQLLPTNGSLPSLQSSTLYMSDKSFKVYEELAEKEKNNEIILEESDSDSEPNIAHNYSDIQNFDSMDLNSSVFESLPPDVKYEILTEMKQKFKGYRNTSIMPNESNDFSSYQLGRLLKKRNLQSKIEETIKQLNGDHSEDILQELDKKGFTNKSELSAGRLVSDESTRYVFLKKSQLNDSQKTLDQINSQISLDEKSDSSLLSNHSFNNQSIVISDSSDSDEELQNPINFSANSESNISIIENNEQKIENSLNKSSFENSIELSDDQNLNGEELKTNVNENENIEFKVKSSESLQKSERSESIVESIANIEFTKIKTIEVNSDWSDDDFEDEFVEVLPQSSQSSHKSTDDKMPQTIVSNNNSNAESSLNFDEFLGISEDLRESIPEVTQPIGLTSISESNDVYIEPKASTSESIELKAVSREELLESCREANKQNRFANHTTDQMMSDCQELLRLFGIPFVISPTEAEAQCAALEQMSLTEGTITDDSDVLLFGAKTVYKNFFTSSKYVELFNSNDIETRFGLTRSSMICIAMLCGSDYTDGVDGVGAVTATEILSEFRGDGLQPLIDLKNWWQNKQKSKDKRPESKTRAKFIKLKLSESFPNKVIFDAYMKPMVDTSTEKFVWGMPQLDELRRYAAFKFGWTLEKCDQTLLPVMKKVNEKQIQMKIDNYFKIQVQPKDVSVVSKRVNKAIDKLKGIESEPQNSGTKSKSGLSALSQKVKNQRKRRQTKTDKTGGQSKRRISKPKPKEINLSESSDSD